MIRRFHAKMEDENADSGTEVTGSDCSKMSSRISLMANPSKDLLTVTIHLLANPGASLLLQNTLSLLLECVRPSLRLFHVSERARPVHTPKREGLFPTDARPSHAVTIFLHESYGEERVLKLLDFLQCPPWQYHHTETCGARAGTISHNSTLMRHFYSLGTGMPIFGVRMVHYGEEVVRVTLNSTYENFDDTVRLYETVLKRRAEEQKSGFCWFTLFTDSGFSLQFAIKQLGPGVRAEPCHAAVLQFRVGEIGQLVPLMPYPCSPISSSRWHTEDLDGNKILFQIKTPSQRQTFHPCAFPLSDSRIHHKRSSKPSSKTPSHLREPLDSCGRESLGSEETTSSCYSSQRSSPAGLSINCLEPVGAIERTLSCLLLEEETDVDTGCTVNSNTSGEEELCFVESPCIGKERPSVLSENEFFI
ncbi:hypothetical protein DNTS_027337 [Danionella cerebrum]|uniref:FAM124 domain-containing protein n=1 Tax=Danionella cerebrum TaxID=2873325 RepID=A0A553MXS6_9TELE|nr:hypothetical protein DNTS_027337 [Danionella translucida]